MSETTQRPAASTEPKPTPTTDRSASDAAPMAFDPHGTARLPNAVDGENGAMPDPDRGRNGQ
ncbi:hypothetical protein [Halostella litorea]|uniref:hypothetical protein n=1 Tax=Halostella litorea TaxID=2528831 RepID=UPI001093091F|nr:hypothetical protein [Halostella litorea]